MMEQRGLVSVHQNNSLKSGISFAGKSAGKDENEKRGNEIRSKCLNIITRY